VLPVGQMAASRSKQATATRVPHLKADVDESGAPASVHGRGQSFSLLTSCLNHRLLPTYVTRTLVAGKDRPMKVSSALMMLIALLIVPMRSGVHAQTSMAGSDDVRSQIEANNHAVGRAIATRDFETLQKLWSPEMLVNSPGNKVLNRAQVFDSIRQDKLAYTSVRTTTDAFLVSKDVAVELGHEVVVMSNGPMAGKPLSRRFTDVWQKSGDRWVQIARQATYIGIDGGAVYGHPDPTLAH